MSNERLRIAPVAAPLRQQVVELMRAAITDGSFKPGDRLVERELCEATQVSRTSVREALRQLEAEGYVEARPNRGIFVASLSAREAADLYAVRAVLEGTAGQLFAEGATDVQRRKLAKLFTDIRTAARGEHAPKMLAAKVKFYELLLDGADNEILRQMLGNIHGRVMLLRSLSLAQAGRLQDTLREMEAVMDAIERRDGKAAFEACADHVRSAGAVIAAALKAIAAQNTTGHG